MFSESIRVNIMSKTVEELFKHFDIKLNETHKTAINIITSAIIFRDSKIIILSEAIHQINRIIKKHNDKLDFVSVLLGIDCISDIDKYGTVTIPLALLISKLTIKREIVNSSTKTLSKKVLPNAVQTLCISELISHLGIPKPIAVAIVNIIMSLLYFNLDDESRIMYTTNSVFKNHKMSDNRKILKSIEFERIIISTIILVIVSALGIKLSSSLIIVNVLDHIISLIQVSYREKNLTSFLN